MTCPPRRNLQKRCCFIDLLERIYNPMPTEKIMGAIEGMTWRVLIIAKGPHRFVTTDNPAFFFRKQGLGLGLHLAEVSFPLSSLRALHGCYQPARGRLDFVEVPPALVKEINRRLISDAERFVFYHRRADWIGQILAKESPHLRLLDWGGLSERVDAGRPWPFGLAPR